MTNAIFKKLDKNDRRERVLNVAANLFAAKGYDAVTILEIAGSAGCSEALLLNLFPTKNELFNTLFNEWREIVQRKMVLELLDGSALATLEKFYNEYCVLKFSRSKEMRPNLEIALISRRSDNTRKKLIEILNNAPDYVEHTIEPVIKIGQQQGEIIDGNANDIATLFWTIIQGHACSKRDFGDPHQATLPFSYVKKIFSKQIQRQNKDNDL